VPLLVVVLLTNQKDAFFGLSREVLGAAIFAVASVTDWLDGYLARRRRQVTGLGQWMDPLADKLLVIAALVSLVYLGLARAWMAAVIIGREFYVTVIRSMAHARGQALPASPLGKIKLIAQVSAILILILGKGHMQGFFVLGQIALWIATVAAIASAVDYTRKINHMLGAPAPTAAVSTSPPAPAKPPTSVKASPPAAARDRISA
jgi:CDP-diacylglycerol--glycerol-3-phosphate 3-phosphatidyltransferase